MVVCMDVSLFSGDQWLYVWMCHCCFWVTTMVVCMDVSLFSSDNNGCMYGCVVVVFE